MRDEDGEVPVGEFKMRHRNTIRIALGRKLKEKVRGIEAPGCCPRQIVPKDISGYRGMLGFTVDVSGFASKAGGTTHEQFQMQSNTIAL